MGFFRLGVYMGVGDAVGDRDKGERESWLTQLWITIMNVNDPNLQESQKEFQFKYKCSLLEEFLLARMVILWFYSVPQLLG
jgi:hypothetical protein